MSNPTREYESKWSRQEHRRNLEPQWRQEKPVKVWGDLAPDDWGVCAACNWARPPGYEWIQPPNSSIGFCDEACEEEYEMQMAMERDERDARSEWREWMDSRV